MKVNRNDTFYAVFSRGLLAVDFFAVPVPVLIIPVPVLIIPVPLNEVFLILHYSNGTGYFFNFIPVPVQRKKWNEMFKNSLRNFQWGSPDFLRTKYYEIPLRIKIYSKAALTDSEQNNEIVMSSFQIFSEAALTDSEKI
jgi:hypothetical protein